MNPQSATLVRGALVLFLFLLIYDGAIRKWALPGGQQIVFLAKDGLLLVAFVLALATLYRRRSGAGMPAVVSISLWLYGFWVALQCVNPSVPNGAVALWGAKAHLLYAALIMLVPLAAGSLGNVFYCIERWYALVTLPPVLLAIAQVLSSPDSILNLQVEGDLEAISYFGEAQLVRVTGTFSYISGMASFMVVAVLVGFWLAVAGSRRPINLLSFALVIATLPVTGSRAVIVISLIGAAIVATAALPARLLSPATAFVLIAISGAAIALSTLVFDTIWTALSQRFADSAEEGEGRVVMAFTSAFDFFSVAGPLGFGSGTANHGAVALVPGIVPFSWFPIGTAFEEENGRLVLELGWLGWMMTFLLRVVVLVWSLRISIGGPTPAIRAAGLLALPFMALAVYQGHGVFAPPIQSAMFWGSLALLCMASAESVRLAAGSGVPHRLARVGQGG